MKHTYRLNLGSKRSHKKRTQLSELLWALPFSMSLLSSTSLIAQNGPAQFLPLQVHAVSTIPTNGDLNPYGVAFIPHKFPAGIVKPGDILVSNFNNSQNLQGTGTTIVNMSLSRVIVRSGV